MSKKITDEAAFAKLLKKHSKAEIAKFCGLPRQSITRWTTVKSNYVAVLSEKTGIPKPELLPSLFA